MEKYLLAAMAIYIVVMLAASLYARKRVKSESDFLVAGRRLSLPFSCATLFATWFGAGTLLTATDEIRNEGLMAAALEPYGAGFCLIIAGLFFAKPLWEMKLLTIGDFFRVKFGGRVEELSIFLTTPGYIAWIAVQLMASAQVLNIFLGVPVLLGISIICLIAMVFTLLGGMWSIAITDLIQMVLIVAGLIAIFYGVITVWGHGSFSHGLRSALADIKLVDILRVEQDQLKQGFKFINVFLIAALGNIPGQDFTQRVFSAKSSKIAKKACLIAGFSYVLVGTLPVFLGLAANYLMPANRDNFILITMAKEFVSPAFSILFILAILAAVFSTLDSSLLATAGPLSHNVIKKYVSADFSLLKLCQICIVVIGIISIMVASLGERIYVMLEASYSCSLAIFFSPLVIGLYGKKHVPNAAITAMITGAVVWSLDIFFIDSSSPLPVIAALCSFASYYLYVWLFDNKDPSDEIAARTVRSP